MKQALAGVFLVAASVTAQAGHDDRPWLPPKGSLSDADRRTPEFGGLDRDYLIQTVKGRGLHPLVIVLHGGAQSAAQVWTQTSLPTLGAEDGFLVTAPDAGKNKHWNDGRGATLGGEGPSDADDVGFLRAMIEEIEKQDNADPKAVFLVGASNGGLMAMHFACTSGAMLRAAGVVIADLPVEEAKSCDTGEPLPWIAISGDNDPLMPFNGQRAGLIRNGQVQPALRSADATFRYFADKAGCAADTISERLPDLDPSDGSTVERRTRSGCAGGTASVQYILHGAGHSWPGATPPRLIARWVGGVNDDVDAGTIVWDFFRSTLNASIARSNNAILP